MPNTEDYYKILGVDPGASIKQIKESYIYKVNILHPDRLKGMPERVRRLAEEEIKKVNMAYEILGDPLKRQRYDLERFGSTDTISDSQRAKQSEKPQPEIYPEEIHFKNALPYVKQKESFFVRNTGGPFKKVLISQPPDWIKVAKTVPLQAQRKLPMQVQIEAIGIQWGKTYSSQIIVKLDGSEAKVKVKLSIQNKPRKPFWKR